MVCDLQEAPPEAILMFAFVMLNRKSISGSHPRVMLVSEAPFSQKPFSDFRDASQRLETFHRVAFEVKFRYLSKCLQKGMEKNNKLAYPYFSYISLISK